MQNLFETVTTFSGALTHTPEPATTVIDAAEKSIVAEEAKSTYISKRFSPSGYRCARFEAHKRLNNWKPKMDMPDAAKLRLFSAGTGVHDMIQQQILAQTRQLYGTYECASCGRQEHNTVLPANVCNWSRKRETLDSTITEKCVDVLKREDVKWLYRETYMIQNPLGHEDYQVSGYRDGIWLIGEDWWILEIKSCDQLAMKDLSKVKHKEIDGGFVLKPTRSRHPNANHIDQGMVYAKMALDEVANGTLDLKSDKFKGLILLYVDRESYSMKEYHVRYTEQPFNSLVSLATATKSAVDEGNEFIAPAKCSSANTVLAKQCPLRDKCFPKKSKKNKL